MKYYVQFCHDAETLEETLNEKSREGWEIYQILPDIDYGFTTIFRETKEPKIEKLYDILESQDPLHSGDFFPIDAKLSTSEVDCQKLICQNLHLEFYFTENGRRFLGIRNWAD